MTRIADIVEIREIPRALDPATLRRVRDALDQNDGAPSLLSGPDIDSLLERYVAIDSPADDPLYAVLRQVAADPPAGAGFMMQGPAGSGKTHLLCVAALLLDYPSLRERFVAANPRYAEPLAALVRRRRPLVVPVALGEHRAEDENLEDIIFDCAEAELSRPLHRIQLPLSEQSYSLDLVSRHILPRYEAELDKHVRGRAGGFATWQDLADADPAGAVAAARAFAGDIGYPLDFRQSRIERMARLSELLQQRRIGAIVWLIDDLWQFLAGAGAKAVRNDISLLEFLFQRSRLEPVSVLVALRAGLEEINGIEPYVLAGIRDGFEAGFRLGIDRMRDVAHKRGIKPADAQALVNAAASTHKAYTAAFGTVTFSAERLARSYPLHPHAEPILESIYQKYFAEGDALIDVLHALRRPSTAGLLERDYTRLVSLPDLFDMLSPRLAAHPRTADYVREVYDYYEKNAERISPQHPDAVIELIKSTILLCVAGTPGPAAAAAELTGLDASGKPIASPQTAAEVLEQMRLRGNYIDRRAGPDGDAYTIDVHANLSELARNRLMTVRSGLPEDDPRVWKSAIQAATSPEFPLAHIETAGTLDIGWQNTTRSVTVETSDLRALTPARLAGIVETLRGAEASCDCYIFIADPYEADEQLAAFAELTAPLADKSFGSGVAAWVPRPIGEEDMESLRRLAACRQILRDPSGADQGDVVEHITQEAAALEPEVARILATAYREGRVVCAGTDTSLPPAAAAVPTWADLLAQVAHEPLNRVFPDFAQIAPRRFFAGLRTVDALIERVVVPGGVAADAEPELLGFARDILEPMGLLVEVGDRFVVDTSSSVAAGAIIDRVRARDNTPQTERGRPLRWRELVAGLVRSPIGMTPEIFELAVACLLRTGWLVGLDESGRSLPFDSISGPLRNRVVQLARSPLLNMGEWRTLTRLTKLVMDMAVTRPDHATQTTIYSRLLAARQERLGSIERMRVSLRDIQRRLGQQPSQWAEAHRVLDELEAFFSLIDPSLVPAEALKSLIDAGQRYLEHKAGSSPLTVLLREAGAIAEFIGNTAEQVVATREYLTDTRLHVAEDADLRTRQQRLLHMIAAGEGLVAQSAAFLRLDQIFRAIYKRRYVSWHNRCYRSGAFDRYRTLRESPELRALAQLQRLALDVDPNTDRAFVVLDAQAKRRCTYEALAEALDTLPVCPNCHLPLDVEPDLTPPEQILRLAADGLQAYLDVITDESFARRVEEYAQSLGGHGELAARLSRVVYLEQDQSARHILTLFNDELISHLNRMLGGKQLQMRELGPLREALAGRTLSAAEIREIVRKWLDGDDPPEDDHLVHVEP